MLYLILVLGYLFFAFQIIKNKGLRRMFYFLLAVFFIPANINIIPNSLFMGHLLYSSSFVISLFIHNELKLKNFKSCPLYWNLTLLLLSCFLIGLLDEFKGPMSGIWASIKYYSRTFLLFYVGWFTLYSEKDSVGNKHADSKDNNPLFYTILPLTLLVTLYGVATFITKTNPILDAVGLEDRFFFEDDESYRSFRVTSTNISSSVYGLACSIFFMCGTFWTKNKSKIQLIAILFLFLNIFLTGTRAAMIPFIVCLLAYNLTYKGINKIFKYSIIGLIGILILIPILPDSITNFISELFGSIVNAIAPTEDGDAKYGGSTLDARLIQYKTALNFLNERPFFGHGFEYAVGVLLKGGRHEGLLGMESYICWIGVEYGLVYASILLLFFGKLLIYFYKNRKYAPNYAHMGISLVIMYIIYLMTAWVGNSWHYIMPILGYITRIIYLRKQQVSIHKMTKVL